MPASAMPLFHPSMADTAWHGLLVCAPSRAQAAYPYPGHVLASGAQCSSGVCWYLMWGESGCAVSSLGLGGEQQVRQE